MAMRRHEQRDMYDGERGAALMMVLVIIMVLMAVTLESMRAMQVDLSSAMIFRNQVRAGELVKSGLYGAAALLAEDSDDEDQKDFDHYGEKWARFMDPEYQDLFNMQTKGLNGTIGDDSGKLPINFLSGNGTANKAVEYAFLRMITDPPFDLAQEDAENLVASIKDWMDSDNATNNFDSAENDYYQDLEIPYYTRNSVFRSVDELRFVKGMTKELLYGEGMKPGLRNFLRVRHKDDGKININTAPYLVLASLIKSPERDDAHDFAKYMVEFRKQDGAWEELRDAQWYLTLPGSTGMDMESIITVQSNYFTVNLTGQVGAAKKRLFAKLLRLPNGKDTQILVVFKQFL